MKSVLVIADDLTGAAEIAGIGLRYGLAAHMARDVPPPWRKGLTVIDTDTRLLAAEEAAKRVRHLLSRLGTSHFDLVYKKVDSVMRGPVLAELEAVMASLRQRGALLAPQNPSRGRIIRNGEYRIDGMPLYATAFANDPEYPARSAQVLDLLGESSRYATGYADPGEPILPDGITICGGWEVDDLQHWAAKAGGDLLPAGGGDFFEAMLQRRGFEAIGLMSPALPRGSVLLVCGSTSAYGRDVMARAEHSNMPICEMPDDLFDDPHSESPWIEKWASEVSSAIAHQNRALMIITQPIDPSPGVPQKLAEVVSQVVQQVLARQPVDNLLMEGGATGSAVCRKMQWHTFRVIGELAVGVVLMEIPNAPVKNIVVKPGSYKWPDAVWH